VYIITHFATFSETPGSPTRYCSIASGVKCFRGLRSQAPNLLLIQRRAARIWRDLTTERPAGLSSERRTEIGKVKTSSQWRNRWRSRLYVARAVWGVVLLDKTIKTRSSKGSAGLPNRGLPYALVNALQTLTIIRLRRDDGLCHIRPVSLYAADKPLSFIPAEGPSLRAFEYYPALKELGSRPPARPHSS